VNIRSSKKTEINKLVEIWYESSLIALDFIDKDYWKSQRTEMEEKYIPLSKTYVVSNEKDVVGIVSMIDSYLDALFIDIKHQGGG